MPGKLGERTHPACCLRHLAANVSQRMTSGPTDVGVLMAGRRKQMLSAGPPDPPLRRYPTLTRLGLVQRWAVLEIPVGDQLRPGAATPKCVLLVCSPHVDNYRGDLRSSNTTPCPKPGPISPLCPLCASVVNPETPHPPFAPAFFFTFPLPLPPAINSSISSTSIGMVGMRSVFPLAVMTTSFSMRTPMPSSRI